MNNILIERKNHGFRHSAIKEFEEAWAAEKVKRQFGYSRFVGKKNVLVQYLVGKSFVKKKRSARVRVISCTCFVHPTTELDSIFPVIPHWQRTLTHISFVSIANSMQNMTILFMKKFKNIRIWYSVLRFFSKKTFTN